MGRIVVYTASFGKTDSLRPLEARDPNVDYVAFTDGPQAAGWTYPPLPAEAEPGALLRFLNRRYGDDAETWLPRLRSKYFKMLSHRLFPDAEYTLWLDARLPPLFTDLRKFLESFGNYDLLLSRHWCRSCLYAEANECRRLRLDKAEVIAKHIERYRREQFPENAGLWEASVLGRRESARTQAFNELWWREVRDNSLRDQISLPYAVSKLDIKVHTVPAISVFQVRVEPHKPVTTAPAKMLVCAVLGGTRYREEAERLFRSLPPSMDLLLLSDQAPYGVLTSPRVLWRPIEEPTKHPISGLFAMYLKAVCIQHALKLPYDKVLYLDVDCFFADDTLNEDGFVMPPGIEMEILAPRGKLREHRGDRYADDWIRWIDKEGDAQMRAAVEKAPWPIEQAILLRSKSAAAANFAQWWIKLGRWGIERKFRGWPDAPDIGLALALSEVSWREGEHTGWRPLIHYTTPQGEENDLLNRPVKNRSNQMDMYATHLAPLLWAVTYRPPGRVLEIGCGAYSTPVLHAVCAAKGHFLLSVEDKEHVLALYQRLANTQHELWRCGNWDRLAAHCHGPWDVVFIDHGPHERRKTELAWARDKASLVVAHDSDSTWNCNYDSVLDDYRYRFEYRDALSPWTVVASMTVPVNELMTKVFPPKPR